MCQHIYNNIDINGSFLKLPWVLFQSLYCKSSVTSKHWYPTRGSTERNSGLGQKGIYFCCISVIDSKTRIMLAQSRRLNVLIVQLTNSMGNISSQILTLFGVIVEQLLILKQLTHVHESVSKTFSKGRGGGGVIIYKYFLCTLHCWYPTEGRREVPLWFGPSHMYQTKES